MGWLKNMFSGFSANETAVEFITKNIGVKINISQDMAFALINEGQRLAREMDNNSFERPRNHIYDSPYTMIGEFNTLVVIFDQNEDEKALEIVCEGIILAFNKYRNEFNACGARWHLQAPTELLHKAQKKLNLPGVYG